MAQRKGNDGGDPQNSSEPAPQAPPPAPAAEPAAAKAPSVPSPGQQVVYVDQSGKRCSAVIYRFDSELKANLEVTNTDEISGRTGTFPMAGVEHDPTGTKPRSWHQR